MARVALKPGLFEPLDDPTRLRLIGGRCTSCEHLHFPSQDTCPYCGTGACQPAALSREGTVYLSTTVTSRPPGYEGNVPYGFGVVELADGIRVISRISDAEHVEPGTPVELALDVIGADEQGNEIVTYAFQRLKSDRQA